MGLHTNSFVGCIPTAVQLQNTLPAKKSGTTSWRLGNQLAPIPCETCFFLFFFFSENTCATCTIFHVFTGAASCPSRSALKIN